MANSSSSSMRKSEFRRKSRSGSTENESITPSLPSFVCHEEEGGGEGRMNINITSAVLQQTNLQQLLTNTTTRIIHLPDHTNTIFTHACIHTRTYYFYDFDFNLQNKFFMNYWMGNLPSKINPLIIGDKKRKRYAYQQTGKQINNYQLDKCSEKHHIFKKRIQITF